ncbi:hypothetical protein [Prosthecochloris sp.]|uniref:hypothetical protein n=1 Tax=Prosthecochloris sp. TaxID=290513 RepID=UPI0025EE9DDC|nr:hypothetical protein [Prosthecochloris sp.]
MANKFSGLNNEKDFPRQAPLAPVSVYDFVLTADTEATCAIPSGTHYVAITATSEYYIGFGSSPISIPTASGTPSPVAYKNVLTIDLTGITTSDTLRIISENAQNVQAQFYE